MKEPLHFSLIDDDTGRRYGKESRIHENHDLKGEEGHVQRFY